MTFVLGFVVGVESQAGFAAQLIEIRAGKLNWSSAAQAKRRATFLCLVVQPSFLHVCTIRVPHQSD